MASILKPDSSYWTSFAGTFGYVALGTWISMSNYVKLKFATSFSHWPFIILFICRTRIHNGSDWKVNGNNFGVLTLEIIMGKHPGDFLMPSHDMHFESLTAVATTVTTNTHDAN